MGSNQISLFPWQESILPKISKREFFNLDLTERVNLSEEELTDYAFLLDKKDMLNFLENVYHKNVQNSYDSGKIGYIVACASVLNKGLPQMLRTSLSQYHNKFDRELLFSDLVVMKKSLESSLSGDPSDSDISRFKKVNNLTFFGFRQYFFMREYFNFKNQ